MFIVILGTKPIENIIEHNVQCFCLHCRKTTECEMVEIKQYITIFFIPLIPFKNVGTFMKCAECDNLFDIEGLNWR